MKIGGLIKSSMIDYPGKISCVFFTCGCNFICPFCHNPSLVNSVKQDEDTGFNVEDVFSFLKKRQGLLDGIVITGGEPTLQKDLASFCEKVKALGYQIKLDTNGSRPEVVKTLMEKELVDYFAMDIKASISAYEPEIAKKFDVDAFIKSIEIIMTGKVPYEFRTTCVSPFVDEHMIRETSDLIKGARLYVLQRFNPEHILKPEFYKKHEVLFTDEDLERFRGIAAMKVASIVRNS